MKLREVKHSSEDQKFKNKIAKRQQRALKLSLKTASAKEYLIKMKEKPYYPQMSLLAKQLSQEFKCKRMLLIADQKMD